MQVKSAGLPGHLRAARNATYLAFAATGFTFSSWASRIPDIKNELGLSASGLGTVLLASALGSAVSLPLAGRIVGRLGNLTTLRVASGVSAAALIAAVVAVTLNHPGLLMVGLAFVGFGNSLYSVAANHAATNVDRQLPVSILPLFHAAFSAATVGAVLVGGLMTLLRVPIWLHVSAALVVLAWTAIVGIRPLGQLVPHRAVVAGKTKGRSAFLEPRILLVGTVAISSGFAEGGARDWLAVALHEGYGMAVWIGVFSYSVFLLAMTIGRFLGARVLQRFDSVLVMRVMAGLVMGGTALVAVGGPVLAFVGVAIWGLGSSLIWPICVRAVANDPAKSASRIAAVSTIAFIGFIAEPIVVGALGDAVGILVALLSIAVVALAAQIVIPAVRPVGVGARGNEIVLVGDLEPVSV